MLVQETPRYHCRERGIKIKITFPLYPLSLFPFFSPLSVPSAFLFFFFLHFSSLILFLFLFAFLFRLRSVSRSLFNIVIALKNKLTQKWGIKIERELGHAEAPFIRLMLYLTRVYKRAAMEDEIVLLRGSFLRFMMVCKSFLDREDCSYYIANGENEFDTNAGWNSEKDERIVLVAAIFSFFRFFLFLEISLSKCWIKILSDRGVLFLLVTLYNF